MSALAILARALKPLSPAEVATLSDRAGIDRKLGPATKLCLPSSCARQDGFDTRFAFMPDDHPLVDEYSEGASDIFSRWRPDVPDGWIFGGKHDTEDGPLAYFFRENTQTRTAEADGQRQAAQASEHFDPALRDRLRRPCGLLSGGAA